MLQETGNPPGQVPRRGGWVALAKGFAGLLLCALGAAGLAVTMMATFSRGPYDLPILTLSFREAALFTGGGTCLLIAGAVLLLGGTQGRSPP